MNKTIRVLHTEWSGGWGGQEIRILAESQAFIAKGYEMTIAAQPDSQLYQKANQAGVPAFAIKMNKKTNFIAMIRFVNFIKKNKIDIVHTHSSVDSRTAGIAARICGIAVVRSRHISVPLSLRKFTWFQYMQLADKVITSGNFIKNMMISRNHMLTSKIASAPAGVDINHFSMDREMIDIKPQFGLVDSKHFIVGIVSVLRSWKGHHFLIEAIKEIISVIPDIRLLIVGDGPQKNNIINLIKELHLEKYVILTGHQEDPAPFFKAIDVMVLPSYAYEATSQVLPQAMAMGKPVISTHVGGLPEVVIDRQTGLVVPPKDSTAIAKAIQLLFSDIKLRQTLAKQGREHTLKNFTFEKMIQTTENVYLEVLKKDGI